MKHWELLQRYLANRKENVDLLSGFPFVTISREAGAGGHVLAREIIRQIEDRFADADWSREWELFDQMLCVKIAQDPGMKPLLGSMLDERYRGGASSLIDEIFCGRSEQYAIHRRTSQAVRVLGMIGRVVLVGRAANFVTADLPNGVHVRVVAPLDDRVRWMARQDGIPADEARRRIEEQDQARRRLVRDYFDKDVADPRHYDLVANVARLDCKVTAAMIVDLVALKNAPGRGNANGERNNG
jgi:cytidylate kinase